MKQNPLSIIDTAPSGQKQPTNQGRKERMIEAEAYYERLWLKKPQRFDPNANAIGRDRIAHTVSIVEQLFDMKGLKILDIGCGNGTLADIFAKEGAQVVASDIASNALKRVPDHENITKKQAALPETSFPDDEFDLCLCAEVIAEINHADYRMTMAELCRVIKPHGRVVVSDALDIHSEDAFLRFQKLAETEFKILHWKRSYHALYIRILGFLKGPKKFFNAWRDPKKRKEGLKHRHGLKKWWFKINSRAFPAVFWAPLHFLLIPVITLMEKSQWVLNFFEKLCRFFQPENGISHVIFVGKRRPLLQEHDEPPLPDRPPFKREVKWE